MFDSDAAVKRSSNLWRKLGGLYEKAAYSAIERGSHETAMRCARMAEACFWQATGEMDSVLMKDVSPQPSAAA